MNGTSCVVSCYLFARYQTTRSNLPWVFSKPIDLSWFQLSCQMGNRLLSRWWSAKGLTSRVQWNVYCLFFLRHEAANILRKFFTNFYYDEKYPVRFLGLWILRRTAKHLAGPSAACCIVLPLVIFQIINEHERMNWTKNNFHVNVLFVKWSVYSFKGYFTSLILLGPTSEHIDKSFLRTSTVQSLLMSKREFNV